jgi:DNA-binding CsgD family transcriptional regulator
MFGHDLYGERCPTEREYRIIALIAQGLNNRDIAREVGTTEHVLKNRLRVIYDKLGRWHRLEVALWYEAVRGSDERANACRPTGIGDLVTASVGPSTSVMMSAGRQEESSKPNVARDLPRERINSRRVAVASTR